MRRAKTDFKKLEAINRRGLELREKMIAQRDAERNAARQANRVGSGPVGKPPRRKFKVRTKPKNLGKAASV